MISLGGNLMARLAEESDYPDCIEAAMSMSKYILHDGTTEEGLVNAQLAQMRALSQSTWVFFEEDSEKMVGYSVLEGMLPSCQSVNIHGVLNREYWGSEYSDIAMKFLLGLIFRNAGLPKAEIIEMVPNMALRNYALRHGFKEEAKISHRVMVNGKSKPITIYALMREDWNGN